MKSGLVFLDWDGTLSHARFWSTLEAEVFQKIQCHLFQDNSQMIDDWMVGIESSESICHWLESRVGLASQVLMDALIASCQLPVLPKTIIDRISSLKKGNHVVLVTDNMDCFTRFTVPALRLNEIFDLIVNSFDIKRHKKNQGGLTFQEIAEKYAVSINDCYLIDDSEKTCSLFNKIGGTAYQASGVQQTVEILGLLAK